MNTTENSSTEQVELLIADVVYPGRGLARLDNMVVFIGGVLPGELVRAEITAKRKNYCEARLLEVLKPSAMRVDPECPLARNPATPEQQVCPGCSYQHMRYKQELRLKDAQLLDLLKRMGGGEPLGEHLQPVAAPSPYSYRNKIVLHASVNEEGTTLGYYGEDNRSVIPLTHCPLAIPEINERLAALVGDEEFMKTLEDHADVTLRFTRKDGVIHWAGKRPKGARWITETTGLGDISVPVRGFSQINSSVAGLLLKLVQAIIRRKRPAALVDLYCGSGLFSLAAAEAHVEAVLGIDSDSRAIQSARYTAGGRRLRKLEFVDAPAVKVLKKALTPLDAGLSMLLVDPPRRGLEKRVLEIIAEHGPNQLLYISCAPDTLARDVRVLREAGYAIETSQLFDMFPRTPHFETLLLLSRKK